MYFDPNSYGEQAAKKSGRKPGSKNRPKPEPDNAASLISRSHMEEPSRGLFVGEPIHEEPAHPHEAILSALETVQEDAELKRMLADRADFKRFGNSARSLMSFVQDASPSEIDHEQEWLSGAPEVGKELAKSIVARNLLDVIHILGSEEAEVVGFWHGEFKLPPSIRYGEGTCCQPWMAKVMEAVVTYGAHLSSLGIAKREGLVVFASDFCFADFDADALSRFKGFCKKERLVVVAAMFGDADRNVAEKFSAPIPPVDLKHVPLAQFIRELTKSVTQSLTRHGALEDLMARSVSGLLGLGEPRRGE